MIVLLNAKESFQKLPEAKAFKDMSASGPFEKALLYALQYYSDRVTTEMPPNAAHMIHGARQFAQCLLNLTEPADLPSKTVSQQLNYKV